MAFHRGPSVVAQAASLTLDDLARAEEAFLTNAVAGVVPLVSVEGQEIGQGGPGPFARRLREFYEAGVNQQQLPKLCRP